MKHLLTSVLCLLAHAAFAQGPLNPPPGAPQPTGRSLEQIYAQVPKAIPITTFPATITQDGTYVAECNNTPPVTGQDVNGITITAGALNVEIYIVGVLKGSAGTGDGIHVSGAQTALTLRGGAITDWGGDGVDARISVIAVSAYDVTTAREAGSGMATGKRTFAFKCVSFANGLHGFECGDDSRVEDCVSQGNDGKGILGAAHCFINRCGSMGNGGTGIQTGVHGRVEQCDSHDNMGTAIECSDRSHVNDCKAQTATGAALVLGNKCGFQRNHCVGQTVGAACGDDCESVDNYCEGDTGMTGGDGTLMRGGTLVGATLAGTFTRTDATRGVWKAPAGVTTGPGSRVTGVTIQGTTMGCQAGDRFYASDSVVTVTDGPAIACGSGSRIHACDLLSRGACIDSTGATEVTDTNSETLTPLIGPPAPAIKVGPGSKVLDCRIKSQGNGIEVGLGSIVAECRVEIAVGIGVLAAGTCNIFNNTVCNVKLDGALGGVGIMTGIGASVRNNTVSACERHGIQVADRSSAIGNVSHGNGTGAGIVDGCGLFVIAGPCVVDGNHCDSNDRGIEVVGGASTIIRNKASGNTGGNYFSPPGNDLGPLGTAAGAGANPFTNFE